MTTAIKLTQQQIELMDHTVSGPDRNWFATSLGCKDANDFDALVEMGLATRSSAVKWMGGDVIYRLTDDGKSTLQNVEREPTEEYKETPGQRRYMAYKDCGTNQTFMEWLKDSSWNEYRRCWSGN